MAKKFEWQQPSIDAGIAVAGGSLLDTYLVGNVQAIADLMMKLPDEVGGISIKAVLLGAVALISARYFMK